MMIGKSTPTGSIVVIGEPHDTDEYRRTAVDLGYGEDTLAMCQDHDPLHVALCNWLGVPSFSMLAATCRLSDDEKHLADAEETAVLAVQKFIRLTNARMLVRKPEEHKD